MSGKHELMAGLVGDEFPLIESDVNSAETVLVSALAEKRHRRRS